MVRAVIKEATDLQRKAYVPDYDRTPDRDELAQWIDGEIVNGDLDWSQTTIQEISEMAGWSREHVSNTLDRYFVPASQAGGGDITQLIQALPTPDGNDNFQSGYRSGFSDGVRWALENRETLEDLLNG